MNCDKCQELISDLLDGALTNETQNTLNLHLQECLACTGVRTDLESILGFCRAHRGEYSEPPNERALWLRIRNMIEADVRPGVAAARSQPRQRPWAGWLGRSWELSLPQLAASTAAIVLVVSLATAVGLRRWQSSDTPGMTRATPIVADLAGTKSSMSNRTWQQQQMINFWNQRVELNKGRWSPQMREAFERNLKVIDQTVSDSMDELSRNPHDEVSEEMLNDALNEKLSLLREFAEL